MNRRVLRGTGWTALLWPRIVANASVSTILREVGPLGLPGWVKAIQAMVIRREEQGLWRLIDACMAQLKSPKSLESPPTPPPEEEREEASAFLDTLLHARLTQALATQDLQTVGRCLWRLLRLMPEGLRHVREGRGAGWETMQSVFHSLEPLGPDVLARVLRAALPTSDVLLVLSHRYLNSDSKEAGMHSGSGSKEGGRREGLRPLLKSVMAEHLRRLRMKRLGEDVLVTAKATMWARKARESVTRHVPPGILGLAMLESAAPDNAGQLPVTPTKLPPLPKKAEEGGEECGVIEGLGGLGVVVEGGGGMRCGVCRLRIGTVRPVQARREEGQGPGVTGHSGGHSGGLLGGHLGGGVLVFACGHGFHAHCVPEQACVTCLSASVEPF